MIDRLILKIREIIHFLFHIKLYAGKKIILYGVPQILYGKNIKFGHNIRINDNVYLHASNGISIGDNTTLSYGVSIITESYDVKSKDQYLKRHHSGDSVIIGRNVWICANSTILPGVTISDNIIVGAGSVVTKDLLEEDSLYAGNPAKFIKKFEWK